MAPHGLTRWRHMAFLDGATWPPPPRGVAPLGFLGWRHMASQMAPHGLPRLHATWLYLVSPHGFTWCRHVSSFFFIIHVHALPCVIHMAPHRVMTMHWMTCVLPCVITIIHIHAWLPCVITIIHIHAWLPCVIHMALLRIMTMHGWHVSCHMSPLKVISIHGWHVS